MKVWITTEPWPATVEVEQAATTAGADLVWHGIPAAYTDQVPANTTGLYELADPVTPPHVPLDPHGQLVTLLVVVGALQIDDAEHVAGPGITAADLQAEAEAWSLGGA